MEISVTLEVDQRPKSSHGPLGHDFHITKSPWRGREYKVSHCARSLTPMSIQVCFKVGGPMIIFLSHRNSETGRVERKNRSSNLTLSF